jgi:hypothetical protein
LVDLAENRAAHDDLFTSTELDLDGHRLLLLPRFYIVVPSPLEGWPHGEVITVRFTP